MSFETAFLELMPDTVVIAHALPQDMYGETGPSSTTTTIKGHVTYKTRTIKMNDGRDVNAHGDVILGGVVGVKAGDTVTLPDGSMPHVIDVELYSDDDGPHHETIIFG